ncbi:MAG TPA: trehalose-phosphatase [Gemmatimonadales bacterium]|nr:trehalose-phosphatase [Gemmatimonadales bacterium]
MTPRRSSPSPVSFPPKPRREWAYFFDLDGTLIDFAATPSAVRVGEDVRLLLGRLYRSTGGAVALMSGRPIADIDRLFPRARMPAAGLHGLERRNGAGRVTRHPVPTTRLERAKRRIAASLNGRGNGIRKARGLLFEDKGLSLALHYRRAPGLASYAHRLARSLLADLGGEGGAGSNSRFCIQRGKYVVEVRPSGKDKGIGVREFMRERPFRGRVAVYVGDDATDEIGFATVNRLGGVSIKVGPGRTAARWRLPDVRAVREWLAS